MTPTSTGNPVSATIDPLVHALSGHDALPPWSARRALEAIGPAATPSLIPVLDSPDPITRWEAAKALSALKDPVSAPALVHALEDNDEDVRWLAAEGLIALGKTGSMAVLSGLIKRAGSTAFCRSAHHVLSGRSQEGSAKAIAPVLVALTGPEPGVFAPAAAYDALMDIKVGQSLNP